MPTINVHFGSSQKSACKGQINFYNDLLAKFCCFSESNCDKVKEDKIFTIKKYSFEPGGGGRCL